jgi:hypothetical protein
MRKQLEQQLGQQLELDSSVAGGCDVDGELGWIWRQLHSAGAGVAAG